MVGWSNRNRMATIRRNMWWASLSDADRERVLAREKLNDRYLAFGLIVTLGLTVLVFAVLALFR